MNASYFDDKLYFIGNFNDGRGLSARQIAMFAQNCPAHVVCATSASNQVRLNRLLNAAGFAKVSQGPRTHGPGYVYLWKRDQEKRESKLAPSNYYSDDNTFCCGLDADEEKTLEHQPEDEYGRGVTLRTIRIPRTGGWAVYGQRIPISYRKSCKRRKPR